MDGRLDFRFTRLASNLAVALLFVIELTMPNLAHADTLLQLVFEISSAQAQETKLPVPRAELDTAPPLRLEYELIAHVENMSRTTTELYAIVSAMPGPDQPAGDSTAPDTRQYANPIDETMGRLDHVEQLIADIAQIIEAMPFSNSPTAQPSITHQANQVVPQNHQAPQPIPASGAPASLMTMRIVLLMAGALLTVTLLFRLRRKPTKQSHRPSKSELIATIEPPPLSDEAIELADIMSAMGLAEGAARALAEYIGANPRRALSHWLKLLEVHRKTGNRTEFESAAKEIRSRFNIKPGAWLEKGRGSEADKSIEDFSHIVAQLLELWPTPACTEYLLCLLADNRAGQRDGFPLTVVEEIVLLLAVLRDEEYTT